MTVEVVRYPARSGEGRPLVWEGVRYYRCPEGCSTAFYDFKKARLVGPHAASARTQAMQQAAWALTGVYVAVGLVALFLLFAYGVSAVPVPAPWVRWLLWVLLVGGFATIAGLLVAPARQRQPGSGIPATPQQLAAPAAAPAAAPGQDGAAPQAAPARGQRAQTSPAAARRQASPPQNS